MNCDPKSLLIAAKCYQCVPKAVWGPTVISLLCEWANHLTPPTPSFSWSPAAVVINSWTDSGGIHGGADLATFLAIADIPTVSVINASATGVESFTNLDSLPSLTTLLCDTNPGLLALDCSNCDNLQTIVCSTTGLVTIDVTNCTSLITLTCDSNGALTTISGLLTCTSLQTLDCHFDGFVTSLPGIGSCTALVSLDCNTCDITGILDVGGLINLTDLSAQVNPNLTGIVVTGCVSLDDLNFSYTSVTSIDLSNLAALQNVICSYTPSFVSANLLGCTNIFTIDFSFDALTTGSVNVILSDMVVNNPPPGFINLSAQTPAAPPDAGPPNGVVAKATLIGLTWIVSTD